MGAADGSLKTPRDIYAAFAVILPVSLGLGLIYLYAMGRIEYWLALLVLIGTVSALPLLAVLGRHSELDELTGRFRRRSTRDDPKGFRGRTGGLAQS